MFKRGVLYCPLQVNFQRHAKVMALVLGFLAVLVLEFNTHTRSLSLTQHTL